MMNEYLYIIIAIIIITTIVVLFKFRYRQSKTYTYKDVYYPNGNVRYSFKQLNATDAEEKIYYETGELNKICHVSRGKRQGDFIVFYKNGKEFMKGKYLNGKYIGLITIFDLYGNIKQTVNC